MDIPVIKANTRAKRIQVDTTPPWTEYIDY